MAFYESPRFPEGISMGATGGPMWATEVIKTVSGKESRIAQWSYPLHQWDVSTGIRNAADFIAVRAFFLTMLGRLHGFRFKDWADYTASHTGDEKGVCTGSGTTFQCVKRYTSGSQTSDRIITKPILSGFELKNSGTPLVYTTDYTLNTVTGVITTATSKTAANLTWSGEFDVPMRFDTDRLQSSIVARRPLDGLLHHWDAIPIVEIRV